MSIETSKTPHETYKLIYVEERGKIDLIKLIFKIIKIDYEDTQIKLNEWLFYKTWIPFEQLPALVINDSLVISHINVICKYLAKKHDLMSIKTSHCFEHEGLLCDMIIEQLKECEIDQLQMMNETDTLKRIQIYNKFLNETLPRTLAGLEKILITNYSNKYIIGDKLTWIDLAIINDFEWLDDVCKKKISLYPKTKKYYDDLRSLPIISEWYAKQKPLHIVRNV